MSTKHIYFIRHGESEYNISPVSLHHDTELTEKGLQQAHACAERCENIPYEVIFSSSFKRATKTAGVINEKKGLPFETNDLFIEYRYPDSVIGLPKKDPSHLDMLSGKELRFTGGETYAEIAERAKKALSLLAERTEESIVIVSHGYFIYAILTQVLFGESVTFRDFECCFKTMRLSNTGITHFEYYDDEFGKNWKLKTWNDDAHLGEVK